MQSPVDRRRSRGGQAARTTGRSVNDVANKRRRIDATLDRLSNKLVSPLPHPCKLNKAVELQCRITRCNNSTNVFTNQGACRTCLQEDKGDDHSVLMLHLMSAANDAHAAQVSIASSATLPNTTTKVVSPSFLPTCALVLACV